MMKKEIIVAALLIPVAFFSGKAVRSASAEPSPPAAIQRATKTTERPSSTKPRSNSSSPHRWATLRRQAGMKPEVLIEDLILSGATNLEPTWITEHLLATNPEMLFREFAANGQSTDWLVRAWCQSDPLRAIPLVLDVSGPFATKIDPDPFSSSPVNFQALGWLDPELGLKTILDLPENRRNPNFFSSLILGIASANPSLTTEYFQRIESSGLVKAERSGYLLTALASVEPAKALEWARSHPRFLSGSEVGLLMDGLCKSDLEGAMKLYSELSDKPHHQSSAFEISNQLAKQDDELSTTWNWLEASVPKDQLAEHKRFTLETWAWKNPDKIVDRIFDDPGMASDPEKFEVAYAVGRKDELIARMDQLPPEAGAKLKEFLIAKGDIQAEVDTKPTADRVLQAMSRSPESAMAEWEALAEEDRKKLIGQLANQYNYSRDPALVLKLVSSSPAQMKGGGVENHLRRLASMDSQAAAEFAEGIEDPSARKSAIQAVYSTWKNDDEGAADAWLAKTKDGK